MGILFPFLAYWTRTMAVLFLKDGIRKWRQSFLSDFLSSFYVPIHIVWKSLFSWQKKKRKHSLQTYLPPECKRHIEDFFSTICRNIGSIYTYFFLLHPSIYLLVCIFLHTRFTHVFVVYVFEFVFLHLFFQDFFYISFAHFL